MDIQPESHYGDPLKTVFLTSLNIYAAYTNAYTPGRSYVERDVRVPVMGKRFAIVATSHNAAIKNITVAVNVQNLWD